MKFGSLASLATWNATPSKSAHLSSWQQGQPRRSHTGARRAQNAFRSRRRKKQKKNKKSRCAAKRAPRARPAARPPAAAAARRQTKSNARDVNGVGFLARSDLGDLRAQSFFDDAIVVLEENHDGCAQSRAKHGAATNMHRRAWSTHTKKKTVRLSVRCPLCGKKKSTDFC